MEFLFRNELYDKAKPKYQQISLSFTEPTNEPISLTELKNYLKIDYTTDDDLLNVLITTSRKQIENELGGLAIVKRSFTQKQTGGLDVIELLISPINSITSITYYEDFDSTGEVISSSLYRRVNSNLYHKNYYWDIGRDGDGYVIVFNSGLVDDTANSALTAPKSIKNAILRICAYLYENRQDYAKNWSEGNWTINYDKQTRNDINLLLMPYHTGKGLF